LSTEFNHAWVKRLLGTFESSFRGKTEVDSWSLSLRVLIVLGEVILEIMSVLVLATWSAELFKFWLSHLWIRHLIDSNTLKNQFPNLLGGKNLLRRVRSVSIRGWGILMSLVISFSCL
jgi:hypothetical protein